MLFSAQELKIKLICICLLLISTRELSCDSYFDQKCKGAQAAGA